MQALTSTIVMAWQPENYNQKNTSKLQLQIERNVGKEAAMNKKETLILKDYLLQRR